MHLRHAGLGNHGERPPERSLVLAREAHDHVGGQVEIGEGLYAPEERGGVVPTAHRAEDTIVARLERNVQVAGSGRRLAQRPDELRLDVVDLDRREAKAGEPGSLPRLAHEARERVAGSPVAVAAEIDPGEYDLTVPLLHAAPDLAQDRLGRPAA